MDFACNSTILHPIYACVSAVMPVACTVLLANTTLTFSLHNSMYMYTCMYGKLVQCINIHVIREILTTNHDVVY